MLVCLDFDGVIVDSLDQQLDVVTRAQIASQKGRTPCYADFHFIENLSPIGFAQQIDIPPEHYPDWIVNIKRAMIETTLPAPIFPHATSMLNRLASQHSLVIISSNVSAVIQASLERYKLSQFIKKIYDCNIPGTKTDKIKQACHDFGYSIAETVMIGDTRSDISHAKLAGAKAIGVTWGYQQRETLALENPDLIIDETPPLFDYLATLSSSIPQHP